jgi:prephenate dehydrogenase
MSGSDSAATVAASLQRYFDHIGARVVRPTVAAHDKRTAAFQVAVHAAVIAVGRTMLDLGLTAEDVQDGVTPPATALLSLLERIVAGQARVYWEIETEHPLAAEARRCLVDNVGRLGSDASDAPEHLSRLRKRLRALLDGARTVLLDPAARMRSSGEGAVR